jgi:excisionase family DNA binding protein
LSEAEAAKFLGISKMTLLRKRSAGIIGFFRVGFRVLYSNEKHLIPFLESCEKSEQVKTRLTTQYPSRGI